MKRSLWSWLLIVALFSVGGVFAQEDDGEGAADDEPIEATESDFYDGIAKERLADGGFVLGDPDAPLTLVEFSDFLCPSCQNYHEIVIQFIDEYVRTGQARFEYRLFPVVDPQLSVLAAQTAECADELEPGLFWEAHDLLFDLARNRNISEDTPATVAETFELELEALETCIETADQYETDSQLAQLLGITGTPSTLFREQGEQEEGNSFPQQISVSGQPWDRGAAPFELLQALIEGEEGIVIGVPVIELSREDNLEAPSLLTGEPCEAPCWRNIIVGETPWEDALAILDEIPVDYQLNEQGVAASVLFNAASGTPCCEMVTQTGESVAILQLRLAPGVTMGGLIETYGEPEYLTGQVVGDLQPIMILVYPGARTLFYASVDGSLDAALSDESAVFQVTMIDQEQMDSVLSNLPLHEWEGYQPYLDYMTGEVELNPR